MNRLYSIILSLLLWTSLPYDSTGRPEANSRILDELDRMIERRDEFHNEKLEKLSAIRSELESADGNPLRFELCMQLFDGYKSSQYDSAYFYAKELGRLAGETGLAVHKAKAETALLFCYKSVGFFKEAADIMENFRADNLPDEILCDFYRLCAETWWNLSSYVYSGADDLSTVYYERRNDCYAKALKYASEGSYEHDWISLELELIHNYSDRTAIDGRKALIWNHDLDDHSKAVQYSLLASALAALQREDEAIYYRAQSAIHDILSCTHETTSIKVLAEDMYRRNDISRAYSYIQQALFNAKIYNSRIRIVEINSILPQIEQSHYNWIHGQMTILLIFGSILSILLTVTVILLMKVRKSSIKMKEISAIKDEYIIQSLYGKSDFVNKVEEQSKFAVRKIMARQYDDALTLLNNMRIKEEREQIYASFDSAFLKLFPNFMDEFNRFFPAEHQFRIEKGSLPMEIRIFALIRLGIRSTSRISEYLNLSVNTIYVYKTQVTSKALVSKEDFTARIMAIPKP